MTAAKSMRLVVVGEPSGWHVGRVVEAARGRGHAATIVRWPELGTAIGGPCVENKPPQERFHPRVVEQADAVLVRGMPTGGLEEVIFRMNLLGRLADRGTRVVNPPRSLELAIDKHLSLARLAAAGLPVPRSFVAQTPQAIREAWRCLGGDAVVKPLFGSQGKGIERLADPPAVERFLAERPPEAVAYLQAFVPHAGWDARLFVLGDEVLAMRRSSTTDWRTNIALGGTASPLAPSAEWIDLARQAARVLGAAITGIDLVESLSGEVFVLEANAVPGWRALESVVGGDIADRVVQFLERP